MLTEISYRPQYPLNSFVDYIWIGKSPDLKMRFVHHAALFTELIFSYGDHYTVGGENTERVTGRAGLQIISGLKQQPFVTETEGIYECIGLLLKPFCYGMLIREFGTGTMEAISEILYDCLFDNENPDFEEAEKCLLKVFGTMQPDPDLMKFEKYLASEMGGKGMLKDFSELLPISQKSFIQKFRKYYFLTPGEYLNLYKMNRAVKFLQNNRSDRLTDIGLNSGFYDQSHFIRVFKKLSGQTPKEFLKSGIR
ncbi:helix-turn-helix transcriptional regulator [Chryseobacterium sp. 2987]|uniref:helix-turn-helix domain-containing protein n=1 Tax=Chryseobacterium sp. 2987 TaxID=2817767 RepID=UPI00286B17B6|nr:helix-turn-helix transcriptional regulator [Chryseobacterium sp. 2987]